MTVARLRSGRPEVLGDLFDQYGRDIHGVAFVILGDPAAAEDVLVDTLVTALERGRDLRDPTALRAWLLRIATNLALGHRRRSSRVVHLETLPDIEAPRVDPDAGLVLWQGVLGLPPRMRAVVALHYYADLPVQGVASSLGISTNTVKSQLRLALGHLRRDLGTEPATGPEVSRA
jgi:RNA polymerase sigma-70 factor (ECF subfamily)